MNKRHFYFKKGDLVEWVEWKHGVPVNHEGEVVGYAGLYKCIHLGSDSSVGDLRVSHRIRKDYFLVKDFSNDEKYIIYGSRLSKCVVKVLFT